MSAPTAFTSLGRGLSKCVLAVLFLSGPLSAQVTDGTVKSFQKSDTQGNFTALLDDFDRMDSVAGLGDLDGDSVLDLAMGAPYDDDGGTDRGAVYILFMNADGTVKSDQKISGTAGSFSATLLDSDGFGWSATGLGDIDGDSVPDIAAGGTGTVTGITHPPAGKRTHPPTASSPSLQREGASRSEGGELGERTMDENNNEFLTHYQLRNIELLCRELRKAPTKTEDLLWQGLRNRKLDGLKFLRQHPFGSSIVDFYCHEKRLVVEVDGGIHLKSDVKDRDKARQEMISNYRVRFHRCSAEQVENNLQEVLENILLAATSTTTEEEIQ